MDGRDGSITFRRCSEQAGKLRVESRGTHYCLHLGRAGGAEAVPCLRAAAEALVGERIDFFIRFCCRENLWI